MNQQLLRRAWDALDSFKQAYPENWQEDDERVMVDLMRADIRMSGVQPKWVGLTDEEVDKLVDDEDWYNDPHNFARIVETKIKQRNT